ncbi:PKDREJ [Branchiostoma lanceolatum]|uniref:PKDREJ protein n=1 Tax=Branchiostoma lanceolatum TaxID=7740 RepID=A0A8J9ZQM8_BRALA|nr:PKDREJ [Branchiostoma lanceolatum]
MAMFLKKVRLTIVILFISGFGSDAEAFLCYAPLGMAEGQISDCEITASSRFDYFRAPSRARLNGGWETGGYAGAWCATAQDSDPWIQVTFSGREVNVTAVVLQGRQDQDQWVTSFRVQYSADCQTWNTYTDAGSNEVQPGVSDRNTAKVVTLSSAVTARCVRINPAAWVGGPEACACLRFELLGCTVREFAEDDCPPGYTAHGPYCYKAFTDAKTYDGAKAACATGSKGGELIIIRDTATQQFVESLRPDPTQPYWIGLDDITTEGRWVYSDGQPLGTMNKWGSGEPTSADCAYMSPAGTWGATSCGQTKHYICQADSRTCANTYLQHFLPIPGFRNTAPAQTLAHTPGAPPEVCAEACISAGSCRSFDDNASSGQCRTSSENRISSPASIVQDAGSTLYELRYNNAGYQGCYKDQEWPDRDIGYNTTVSTLNECISHCRGKCKSFAAMQGRDLCFCSNYYGRHGEANAWECNIDCRNETQRKCGGNLRSSIYAADRWTPAMMLESLVGFQCLSVNASGSTFTPGYRSCVRDDIRVHWDWKGGVGQLQNRYTGRCLANCNGQVCMMTCTTSYTALQAWVCSGTCIVSKAAAIAGLADRYLTLNGDGTLRLSAMCSNPGDVQARWRVFGSPNKPACQADKSSPNDAESNCGKVVCGVDWYEVMWPMYTPGVGDDPPTSFTLVVFPANYELNHWRIAEVPPTNNSYFMGGLSLGEKYHVIITANRPGKVGAAILKDIELKPDPPGDPHVVKTTSSSICVLWNDSTAIMEGYRVDYFPVGGSADTIRTVDVPPTTTVVELTGLLTGQQYNATLVTTGLYSVNSVPESVAGETHTLKVKISGGDGRALGNRRPYLMDAESETYDANDPNVTSNYVFKWYCKKLVSTTTTPPPATPTTNTTMTPTPSTDASAASSTSAATTSSYFNTTSALYFNTTMYNATTPSMSTSTPMTSRHTQKVVNTTPVRYQDGIAVVHSHCETGDYELLWKGDAKIYLDTYDLEPNTTYVIKVAASKELVHPRGYTYIGEESFEQNVFIVEGDPPMMSINCIRNCKWAVDVTESLALRGNCTSCEKNSELTYGWRLFREVNSTIEEIHDWNSLTSTGKKTSSLAIKADQWDARAVYRLRLNGFPPDGLPPGFIEIRYPTSPPLYTLDCVMIPDKGMLYETNFSASCELTGWTGELEPRLTYEFTSEVNAQVTHLASVTRMSKFTVPLELLAGDPASACAVLINVQGHTGGVLRANTTISPQVIPPIQTHAGNCRHVFERMCEIQALLLAEEYKPALLAVERLITYFNFLQNHIGTDSRAALNSYGLTAAVNQILASTDITDINSTCIGDGSSDTPWGAAITFPDNWLNITTVDGVISALSVPITATGSNGKLEEFYEYARSATAKMVMVAQNSMRGPTLLKRAADSIKALIDGKVSLDAQKQAVTSAEAMAGELLSLGSNDYKQNMAAVGGLQQGLNSLMGSARSTPSDDQTEEQAEHAKKATNAVTSATTTLGTVVLNHRLPGEPSVGFQYDNFGVAFQKRYSESVGSEGFAASEGSVSLPKSEDSMKSSDEALNTKFMNFNENPFDWDNTSKIVTKVVSLDLTSETGGAFKVKDTANDISIFVGNDADPPEPRLVTRNISEPGKSEMLYHEITVPYNSCAIFTAFVPFNRTVPFQAYVKYGQVPTEDDYNFTATIPPGLNFSDCHLGLEYRREDWKNYIVSFQDIAKNGTYYLGLKEINQTDDCGPGYVYGADLEENTTTVSYDFLTITPTCRYWDAGEEKWDSQGCRVGPLTTMTKTHCLCNHLTAFAGEILVAPNTIDFSTVFAKFANLGDNAAVFATVLTMYAIYFIVVYWARRADKKDVVKWSCAPLLDNRPGHRYWYKITVYTGVWNGAATKSRVGINVVGETGKTGPRVLEDGKRQLFTRGSICHMAMATEESLGPLVNIRLWHDNSGKGEHGSWFCDRVVIQDLETNERWFFICQRWLGVEHEDGRVDRVLPVASKDEVVSFSNLFQDKTRQDITDGHIWFSVVSRPTRSHFTRVQRASCCLSLIFCTMIASAMFYQKSEGGNTIKLGPFVFSVTSFMVSIQSTFIVFPVNLAVVLFFKKSRPLPEGEKECTCCMKCCCCKKQNKVEEKYTTEDEEVGLETVSSNVPKDDDESRAEGSELTAVPLATEERDLESDNESNEMDNSKEGEEEQEQGQGQEKEEKEETEEKKKEEKKEKKDEFIFPHWCVYFGWILTVGSALGCGFFIILYSMEWGPEKSNEWLGTILMSMFQSILVVQPIKVILLAALLSYIFRNKADVDQVGDTDTKVKPDEELLCAPPGTVEPPTIQEPTNDSSNEKFLEEARELRRKEIKAKEVMKEVFIHYLFVSSVFFLSYGDRDPTGFYVQDNLHGMFSGFEKVKNHKTMFKWLEGDFVNHLVGGKLGSKGYLSDNYSFRLGSARLHQVRYEPTTCMTSRVPYSPCKKDYSVLDQQETSYEPGWKRMNATKAKDLIETKKYTPWMFQETGDLFPYSGETTTYSSDGYFLHIGKSKNETEATIKDLKTHLWLDDFTKAVIIDIAVYNVNVNLFSVITFLAEYLVGGVVSARVTIKVIRLYSFVGDFGNTQIAMQVIFVVLFVYYLQREIKLIIKEKKAHFRSMWNWVDFLQSLLCISVIAMFAMREGLRMYTMSKFQKNPGRYISFRGMALYSDVFIGLIGALVFVATLKLLHLLRFNKRVAMLSAVINHAAKDLGLFSIILMTVLSNFTLVGMIVFGTQIKEFSGFIASLERLIAMLLGDLDFASMSAASPFLGPLFFFGFILLLVFLLLNMFVSIIDSGFGEVNGDESKMDADHEIVDFMWFKLKQALGIGMSRVDQDDDNKAPEDPPLPEGEVEEKLNLLQQRVDKMAEKLSNMDNGEEQ